MVLTTILFLIYANAISNDNDKSVFYSRISLLALTTSIFITYNNLYIAPLHKGIGLYNGLLNISSLTQSFTLFILIITSIVLINNCFFHTSLIIPNKTKGSITEPVLVHTLQEKAGVNVDDNLKTEAYINTIFKNYILDTKTGNYNIVEYGLIINFILCGAIFLMSSGDLISLFISIELQSYALYILSTINKDSEQATWGGLTYFLLGGLSSCFILLASSLIYINTGTTSLDGFYIITSITDISMNIDLLSNWNLDSNSVETLSIATSSQENLSFMTNLENHYINISLILLSVGFLFKVSAAPFHFWSPDVYDAIPTTVTTYVAIIAKLSIFILLLELIYYTDGSIVAFGQDSQNIKSSFSWKDTILLSSLLSLIFGSVLGLTQYRIKRLYAYSTISHVGFILLALCVNKIESIQAYIFYILSYTISNLNAFLILLAIGYTMYMYIHKHEKENIQVLPLLDNINGHDKDAKKPNIKNFVPENLFIDNIKQGSANTQIYENKFIPNNLRDARYSPIQLVSQLKGYFYINSYLALSLTITLFSFIGIPPLIGFFAKQMVLSAALDNGYIFITLVGIITSVISAAYYLNIIKTMFFSKSDYVINAKNNLARYVALSSPLSIIISLLTLFLILFIFVPNESFKLARALSALIFI